MNQVKADDIEFFRKLLGPQNTKTDKEELRVWGKDWTTLFEPEASLVLLPNSTLEVSQILAYCSERRLAVVPSGGRTGLAGGAVATRGEIVLSLSRMNRIVNLDLFGMSIEAEAGVCLQSLQEAAQKEGVFFPLDLAAKGSCQIGGNIATNAGGLKFIRFGGMREQVLGLEVVLASGQVLNLNTNLRKNNTGYDLKQLFVGSEGTLGVITRATLRLVPRPSHLQVACIAVPHTREILELFKLCQQQRLTVSAFEFFSLAAHRKVLQFFPKLRSPFAEESPYYVLLEIEGEESALLAQLEALLEKALTQSLVTDAVLAQSSAQFAELWSLRENITESLAQNGHVRKNDVALPIADISVFVAEVEALFSQMDPRIAAILFGHIGDGNIHINYIAARTMDRGEFNLLAEKAEKGVFSILQKFRGSVSAEHGIGLMRKDDIFYTRTREEVALMRQLKQTLDPIGILNPGKIFDAFSES